LSLDLWISFITVSSGGAAEAVFVYTTFLVHSPIMNYSCYWSVTGLFAEKMASSPLTNNPSHLTDNPSDRLDNSWT